ncbi:hypothetical protein [Jidongwangia harbinensis]|uniref:hypothetical protein n=1 Tax=Jidongwangia harbinensis TaxID=2878561 RepID=UPI001CD95E4B|nr:hypothetical protein [Jidongwangia harbinensis]MCA2215342.1 hypothetical protein [Jidongwangia harbinensis]
MGRRRSAALLTTAALLAAAGCTSDPEPRAAPEIATLASAGSKPPASAPASPVPERPRERLDDDADDWEVMIRPYEKCMAGYGVSPKGIRLQGNAGGGPAEAGVVDEKAFKKAEADCRPKYYPLPPWEHDPANPEAKDFVRDVVKCLKGKGVKYVEPTEDGLWYSFGGPQNHADSISRGMNNVDDCERDVATRRK